MFTGDELSHGKPVVECGLLAENRVGVSFTLNLGEKETQFPYDGAQVMETVLVVVRVARG